MSRIAAQSANPPKNDDIHQSDSMTNDDAQLLTFIV